MAYYDTVASIVSDAAILLGLTAQPIAAPYASTDPNIIQLLVMLKSAGRDLARAREWAHLRVQYTLLTSVGVETYALPAGFSRFVDQTAWNRSSSLPLGGPVSPQGWQALKTLNLVSAIQLYFRTQGDTLTLHPVPQAAYTLALEYVSRYWVSQDADGAGNQDAPGLDGDLVLFDGQMMVHRLRRDFQRLKGFDSTAAGDDYEAALSAAAGNDAAAPVLSLSGSRGRARQINNSNLPPTGFGS